MGGLLFQSDFCPQSPPFILQYLTARDGLQALLQQAKFFCYDSSSSQTWMCLQESTLLTRLTRRSLFFRDSKAHSALLHSHLGSTY